MEKVPFFVLAALLNLFAAGLVYSHARSWRQVRSESLDPRELDYRRRQFRRRTQASVMIGLVGVALAIGAFIPQDPPTRYVVYWCGVILVTLWFLLLAVSDMISTRNYFARVQRDHLVERAKLEAQLRRAKAIRGNGHAKSASGKQPL